VQLSPTFRAEINVLAAGDVTRVGNQVAEYARRYVRVRTSRTQRSIRAVPRRTARGPMVRVQANVPYGLVEEQGSPPHKIRPRRKKYLRFVINGRVVYAKEVNHPGTKGSHFLSKAVRQVAGLNGYAVRING
jgi:hypothetical protein